ncbi:3-keto-5-aminohexanoate cleavage protein [Mesorhizobium sp. CA13]|uniref:3-keto-5-aminohexanoate cleavage protein n=1 Tax=Mesorhizobium sp. CA13 TaxID=2876643 RepID=UPI001CCE9AEB|nr:3-keto-5-aminohexanoate cleavage protein [Mesorhizobium sp. CA13]MBZ9853523.1 3-keto-5-aminohexanoate cleavage protein [Mesorhizobium sp. CA13]
MVKPLFVMVAPNGARRTKADHPALPISANELASTAVECRAAGAAAMHLHIRDPFGRHSLDVSGYAEAVRVVSTAVPRLTVQVTTEAASICTVCDQERVLSELKPHYASVSIAEILRDGEERAIEIVQRAIASEISIQYILYSAEDIRTLSGLRGRLFDDDRQPSTLLVAGRYGVIDDATVDMVDDLYRVLSAEGLAGQGKWMACAFGRGEMACLEAVIELGGHVRVGFENAIIDAHGKLAVSNAERVAKVAEMAATAGRPLADEHLAPSVLG